MTMVTMTAKEVLNTPLIAEQKARLQKVADMPDEMIDYSDIPELDISIEEQESRIVKNSKNRYKLAQLMAEMSNGMSIIDSWNNLKDVGLELDNIAE